MILSKEDQPRTHSTVCEVSRETGIPKSPAVRIVRKDLQLEHFLKHNKFGILISQGSAVTYLKVWWTMLYEFYRKCHNLPSNKRILKMVTLSSYSKLNFARFWDTVHEGIWVSQYRQLTIVSFHEIDVAYMHMFVQWLGLVNVIVLNL